MVETLVSFLLMACPMPDEVRTTACHEFFINCAVVKDGEITNKSIESCNKKWAAMGKDIQQRFDGE